MKSVTGRLSHVTDDMFIGYGKVMTVECFARYGEQVFDSKKMLVKKVDSLGQIASYPTASPGYAANPYSAPGPGSSSVYAGSGSGNPYLRDPTRSDDSDQVKGFGLSATRCWLWSVFRWETFRSDDYKIYKI